MKIKLIIIFLLLFTVSSFAQTAYDTFYVFEDTSAVVDGGDDDGNVCTNNGGSYRCFENYYTAVHEAIDATFDGDSAITVLLDGEWDNPTSASTISRSSAEMQADNWIKIKTINEAFHGGDPYCEKCFRVVAGFDSYLHQVWESSIWFDGIVFRNTKDGELLQYISGNAGDSNRFEIENCIFMYADSVKGTDSTGQMITANLNSRYISIYNCIFIGFRSSGYWTSAVSIGMDSMYLFNNTFYDCESDGASNWRIVHLSASDTDSAWVYNNLFMNCKGGEFFGRVSGAVYSQNSDYNMTDSTDFGTDYTENTNDEVSKSCTFLSASNDSLMLISGDDAIDEGVNCSGFNGGPIYNYDITRTEKVGTWDAGAYEYSSEEEETNYKRRRDIVRD